MRNEERKFLKRLSKKLAKELNDIIYVGILDIDKKLIVGNLKDGHDRNWIDDSMGSDDNIKFIDALGEPRVFYYLFTNIEKQLYNIDSDEYDYLSISNEFEEKFKLIILPINLYDNKLYYVCLYLFSDKLVNNIMKYVFNILYIYT